MTQSKPTVSVIVPCFNEEALLAELVRRCSESASLAAGYNYELILIDDGSTDGTWDAILRNYEAN